jgi:hypothetical protein
MKLTTQLLIFFTLTTLISLFVTKSENYKIYIPIIVVLLIIKIVNRKNNTIN